MTEWIMTRGPSQFWLTSALILAVLAAFQNCGSTTGGAAGAGQGKEVSQRVVADAQGYNKIVYDPLLEISSASKTYSMPHLEMDLNAGTLRILHNSASASCPLDSNRLDSLRSILSTAKVCEPTLPAGQMSCMAIGMADIELSNADGNMYLRPVVCMNGAFLCDGLDQSFRDVLADLRDNPPAGCTLQ